jgi:hypothetical protein
MKTIVKIYVVAVITGHLFCLEDPYKVNNEKKKTTAYELVNKAVEFLEQNPVQKAFHDFQHDFATWRRGELRPFVINQDGYMIVNSDTRYLWESVSNIASIGKSSLVQEMRDLSDEGGWFSYMWNNALFHAFVRTIIKDGKKYSIGVGFYPDDPQFFAEYLVDHIINLCEEDGCKNVFKALKDNDERVVFGPVGVWIIDDNGVIRSCSSDSCMTGKKLLWKDTIFNELGDKDEAWIYDTYNNSNRSTFVRRFYDRDNDKSYIIGAHYYEDVDQDALKSLVKRTAQYIKLNAADIQKGIVRAPANDFIKGSIAVLIFDDNNHLIADYRDKAMSSPMQLDQIRNILGDKQDHFTQIYQRRAYKDIYIEKVVTQFGIFYVAAGSWDFNKAHSVHAMINRAEEALLTEPLSQAFADFSNGKSDFLRGDIDIAVYAQDGTTLVDSTKKNNIWRNCKDVLDENGRNIFDTIVAAASEAGSWIESPMYQADRRMFVKLITLPEQVSDTAQHNGDEMVVSEEDPLVEKYKNSTVIVESHYYL